MKGYFFNAQATADTVTHPTGFDREYDALDYQSVMSVFYEDGVFVRRDPDACKVVATGMTLTITPGVAMAQGGQCHFEGGDGLTLTQGDGKYSVMCRRNNAPEVRAFELMALHGTDGFPAPVRQGDVYDLCLAHVTVSGESVSVEDTRADKALCGEAILTGTGAATITAYVTLTAAGWTGSAAPYTQTVRVPGITAHGVAGLAADTTAKQRETARLAQLDVLRRDVAAQTVTFVADGVKPTVDLPCVVEIYG